LAVPLHGSVGLGEEEEEAAAGVSEVDWAGAIGLGA